MSSFRLAHTFALAALAFCVCTIAVPILYHNWADAILWAAAAWICAYVATHEAREVRAYRRYEAKMARDRRRAQFYANATDAENKLIGEVAE